MKYLIISFLLGLNLVLFAQTKKTTTTKATTTKKTTTAKKTTAKKPGTTQNALPKTNSAVFNPTQAISGVNPLSESEIGNGLKEALIVGAKNAASQLGSLDGFNKNQLIRIPFPPEVSQVATKLREVGFGSKIDEFETTLNRAAEQAAKDAAPIFTNAITSMSISDAKNILTGGNTSATSYLQGKRPMHYSHPFHRP